MKNRQSVRRRRAGTRTLLVLARLEWPPERPLRRVGSAKMEIPIDCLLRFPIAQTPNTRRAAETRSRTLREQCLVQANLPKQLPPYPPRTTPPFSNIFYGNDYTPPFARGEVFSQKNCDREGDFPFKSSRRLPRGEKISRAKAFRCNLDLRRICSNRDAENLCRRSSGYVQINTRRRPRIANIKCT